MTTKRQWETIKEFEDIFFEHYEGIGKITELLDGVTKRLDEKGHSSLGELKGNLSLQSYVEPWAFERASYLKLLQSYGR